MPSVRPTRGYAKTLLHRWLKIAYALLRSPFSLFGTTAEDMDRQRRRTQGSEFRTLLFGKTKGIRRIAGMILSTVVEASLHRNGVWMNAKLAVGDAKEMSRDSQSHHSYCELSRCALAEIGIIIFST
jgi:hypothetical protein